jgi:hypothetical protein
MPRITTLDTSIVPTTVGSLKDGFHPGLKYGLQIWYWTDLFESEEDAAAVAADRISVAVEAINDHLSINEMKSLT